MDTLKDLVRDFIAEVTMGMSVRLVDTETGQFSTSVLVVDESLETFSMTPSEDQPRDPDEKPPKTYLNIRMKDVRALYSGVFSLNKTEITAELQPKCIGMDIKEPGTLSHILFYFDDANERHRFFTCMKVLRSNIDRMR